MHIQAGEMVERDSITFTDIFPLEEMR